MGTDSLKLDKPAYPKPTCHGQSHVQHILSQILISDMITCLSSCPVSALILCIVLKPVDLTGERHDWAGGQVFLLKWQGSVSVHDATLAKGATQK